MIRLSKKMEQGVILVACLLAFVSLSQGQSLNLLNTTITYSAGTSSINFTLTSTLGSGVTPSNAWLGLGFNTASQMAGSGVVACIYSSGSGAVQTYLNAASGYNSALLSTTNPTVGISNANINIADGNFTCTFTRDMSNSLTNYFNLSANPQPYLEIAFGVPNNGAVAYHAARAISSTTVNLMGSSTTNTTTNITVQGSSFQSGIFNVQWSSSSSDSITFTLTTQTSSSSNIWTAIAFSTDTEMGSDDVVACVYSTNLKGPVRYYNQGNTPVKQPTNNGISSGTVTVANGALSCSFVRSVNISNDANFYNLVNSYYLLAAYGTTADSGSINIHSAKVSSPSSINFLACSSSGGATGVDPKLKAHGAMMVIAWMFCASTGIIIARYFKHMFPNKKPFNLAMWFVIHRPLMMFVPFLSVIAFIVVLAAASWKWVPTSEKATFAHSIFGIFAIVFSIVQVFIAFFRCDKDHPKRFIFNHFHRFVGVSAFLFALVAIFIGVTIEDMQLGNSGIIIMIIWVIWIVLLPIVIEIVQFIWRKKNRSSATDMDQNKDVTVPVVDDGKLNKIKAVFLIGHLLVAFSLTLALVIVIATAQNQSVSINCSS